MRQGQGPVSLRATVARVCLPRLVVFAMAAAAVLTGGALSAERPVRVADHGHRPSLPACSPRVASAAMSDRVASAVLVAPADPVHDGGGAFWTCSVALD